MNYNFRKGQVTMFIILGMVVFFFFLLVFFQTNIKNKELMNTVEDQISTLVSSASTQNFINLCLEKTAKEAVYLIGQQGGYIYDYQGGYISPGYDLANKKKLYRTLVSYDLLNTNPDEEYIKYNISYSLYYNQSKNLTFVSPLPPMYPAHPDTGRIRDENNDLIWPGYTIREEIMPKTGYNWRETKYYLGDVNGVFPKLCIKDGKNYQAGENQNWSDSGCGDGAYGVVGENTIQEQLEYYISNKLKNCTNFNELKKQIPSSAHTNILEGEIESTVFFGEEDLIVKVSYPIEASINRKNSKVVINDFQVKIPIRLKKIWKHINDVLYKDSIRFSYKKDNKNTLYGSLYWDENFRYTLTSIGFDELYTITDKKSIINQKDYSFKALIQNRRPALEYIHKQTTTRGDLSCFDVISWPEKTIIITPEGYDPDEDTLTYDYAGWKQNYDSIFYEDCYISKGPIDCTKDIAQYFECEQEHVILEDLGTWTDVKSYYKIDNKTGSYLVTPRDLGVHRMNVTVSDGEMKDWQELWVLIFDSPRVIITTVNSYDDIDNRYTSVEDYMVIGTDFTNSLITLHNFNLKAVPLSYYGDSWEVMLGDQERLQIPTIDIKDTNREPPEDIYKIIENTDYKFEEVAEYNLTLRADNGMEVGQSNLTVDVKECLPHRANSEPYPYSRMFNPDIVDPYQANHACCKGNPVGPSSLWERYTLSEEEICFDKFYYGAYTMFKFDQLPDLYEDVPSTLTYDYSNLHLVGNLDDSLKPDESNEVIQLDLNDDRANDVFKRSFTRECDGLRGNICNGTIIDTIEIIDTCDDINQNAPRDVRRCVGPVVQQGGFILWDEDHINLPVDVRECIEYEDLTFEYLATGNTDESLRVCNEERKCSTSSNYDSSTGTRLCQATCDGNGGCTKTFDFANCEDCTVTRASCDYHEGEYKSIEGGCSNNACVSGDISLGISCDEGYACNSEGTRCANSCTSPNIGCVAGYECVSGDCVAPPPTPSS